MFKINKILPQPKAKAPPKVTTQRKSCTHNTTTTNTQRASGFKIDFKRFWQAYLNSDSRRILGNQRGVALLIAIFSITLLTFLAMEVAFETNVEYISSGQEVNRLKAYYAAKGAVEMSLLRISIYKKALATFGEQLGDKKNMLDPIWQFPFAWPPSAHLPKDISGVEASQIKSVEKESLMKGTQYLATISSEGSRIDLNDLGSASKTLREATKKQILQIFERRLETDNDFSNQYGSFEFERLVNNMVDWVDEDRESLNGGDEASAYSNLELDPEFNRDFLPPNQPFKTLKELHMVAEMNDDFYEMLKERVTTFGTKGVNVNYASQDVLKSLDPNLTEEALKSILERRDNPDLGGPFKNEDDFISFISQWVNKDDFNPAKIPLIFDAELNFRIQATGTFGKSAREITVVTYDFDQNMERLISFLDKENKKKNEDESNQDPDSGQGTDPNDEQEKKKKEDAKKEIKVPKGRPRVVYWHEV